MAVKLSGGEFGCLNVALRRGYETVAAVKDFALGYIESKRCGRISMERLASLCHLEDHSDGIEPKKYLVSVLSGEAPMTCSVFDRLCMALEIRGDEPFPLVSVGNDDAYDIYEKMTGGDIRKDPVRKDFRVESLGTLRVIGIRERLGWV